jgi:hypothetical protein
MKKLIFNILSFIRKLFFGKTELPPINTPADAEFVFELQEKIKEFRLNNYVLPLSFCRHLQYLAQDRANFNYLHSEINDQNSHTLLDINLRKAGINIKSSDMLCVETDGTYEDCFRELISNQKYRGAILNGFNTIYGIGKCEKYISIILAG